MVPWAEIEVARQLVRAGEPVQSMWRAQINDNPTETLKIGLFYTTLKISLLRLFLGLQIYEFYVNFFYVKCCYYTTLRYPLLLLTSRQESDLEN